VAVRALDVRLTERLTAHITAVRDAATDLLDLAMPALPLQAQLAPTGRFGYSFAPDPGQAELLATAVRTRLPRSLARRRIAAHVTDRADTLLDRHVGRASAAFRQQLTDTERTFTRAMYRRYAEGAGRITEAIYAAADLRAAHRPKAEELRRSATSTFQGTRAILAAAERLAGPPLAVPDPRGHREHTPA
jgi:hypothetical protein